jgi:hypothetical protein
MIFKRVVALLRLVFSSKRDGYQSTVFGQWPTPEHDYSKEQLRRPMKTVYQGQPGYPLENLPNGQPGFAAHNLTQGQPRQLAHNLTQGQPGQPGQNLSNGQPGFAAHNLTQGQPGQPQENPARGHPVQSNQGPQSQRAALQNSRAQKKARVADKPSDDTVPVHSEPMWLFLKNQAMPRMEGRYPSQPYTILTYRSSVGQTLEEQSESSKSANESGHVQPYITECYSLDETPNQGQDQSQGQGPLDETDGLTENVPYQLFEDQGEENQATFPKTRVVTERAVPINTLTEPSPVKGSSLGEGRTKTRESFNQYVIVTNPLENNNQDASGDGLTPKVSNLGPNHKAQGGVTLADGDQIDATRVVNPSGSVASVTDKVKFSPFKPVAIFLLGLFAQLKSTQAWALGLGGLGQNVASNLTGIAKAVQMFGFAAGLTLVVMGLLELYNTGRSHDATLKGGITKCVVGAALLAVDAIISTFSTTIFGGNQSSQGIGGLGL